MQAGAAFPAGAQAFGQGLGQSCAYKAAVACGVGAANGGAEQGEFPARAGQEQDFAADLMRKMFCSEHEGQGAFRLLRYGRQGRSRFGKRRG